MATTPPPTGGGCRRSLVTGEMNHDNLLEVLHPDRLRQLFSEFDLDSSGSISPSEFEQIMVRINSGMSTDEIAELARQADKDGDAQIDFEEFSQLMKSADNKLVNKINSVKSHYLDEKAIAAGAQDIIWYSDEMIIAREQLKDEQVRTHSPREGRNARPPAHALWKLLTRLRFGPPEHSASTAGLIGGANGHQPALATDAAAARSRVRRAPLPGRLRDDVAQAVPRP